MAEELAIMRDVDFGCRDTSEPILWFTARLLGGACLLVIPADEAIALIRSSGVYSIEQLNGRGCVVIEERGVIKFVRLTNE